MHFISGLPRSGSTLLSALLRQNPRFAAGVTSPLAGLCGLLHQKMSNGEFQPFFDQARRATMLRGLFDNYYAHIVDQQIVFDTNRLWTGRVPLLSELYPRSRVICCVRDVGWILDSIERLRARHPLHLPKLFTPQAAATVYTRAESLMNAEKGLVGLAWTSLRGAWFSEHAHRLIVIPYENFVRRPEQTLRRLYEELDEEPYAHDLQNVRYEEPDYDEQLGLPGLHAVRAQVQYEERATCLPPDLFGKYSSTNFWTNAALNTRGVTIL
jgi:sulfotransferase